MSVRHRLERRTSTTPSTVLLAGACAILAFSACSKPQAPAADAPAVNVVKIEKTNAPVYGEFVGQTDAPTNVEIRPRVEGYIDQIAYTEGGSVKTGDLLYQLDPRPFQAALQNAKADLAKAKAQLQRAVESVDLV